MKPKSQWPGILFVYLIGLFFTWLALGAPLPGDDRLPPWMHLALDYVNAMTQARSNPP